MPTLVAAVVLTLGALFPIMNPFSTAPLFVSLSGGMSREKQRREAFLGCAYAFGILVGFLLIGSWIIDFFGISIPGIRVAGGLIISTVGFRMLFPQPPVPGASDGGADETEIAFTPIAMPSLAGPGSISVVLSSAAQVRTNRPDDWVTVYAGVVLGILACVVISFVVLRASTRMTKVLGKSGLDAMTRIFGFLLICIGMQFLLSGVDAFFGITGDSAS